MTTNNRDQRREEAITRAQAENAAATKPAKTPGNGLMQAGALIAFIAIVFMIASSATTFADGTHGGPTAGTILMLLAGGVLALIGFLRRILAAVERRDK